MILIPEIKTVVILTPRTGSGSAYRAITSTFPKSLMLYRHMEADGVPQGYDRWGKVGVVRDPVDRLWSLFKFLKDFKGNHPEDYMQSMKNSVVGHDFNSWIIENNTTFTSPYDSSGLGRFYPEYSVRHPLPENKKSQFVYLRPDLGTTIFQFNKLDLFADRLGIKLQKHNQTEDVPYNKLSPDAFYHINKFFDWDLSVTAKK